LECRLRRHRLVPYYRDHTCNKRYGQAVVYWKRKRGKKTGYYSFLRPKLPKQSLEVWKNCARSHDRTYQVCWYSDRKRRGCTEISWNNYWRSGWAR
jgi:hypothetical protein